MCFLIGIFSNSQPYCKAIYKKMTIKYKPFKIKDNSIKRIQLIKMKKTIYLFLIVVLCIGITFTLSHELRVAVINLFENSALWLYPVNDNRNAELLKILLSAIAGLGVLVGVYVSLWRAKTTEKSVKLQSEAIDKQGQQIQLSVKSQIDERFSNAIEHLGSDKEPVLLGGIAELHQIAKENQNNYAEVVFNILCSYIRSNTNIYKKKSEDINFTEIQTIIDYLFKPANNSENPYIGFKADLNHSNLVDVDINNCDFSGADFSYCYMPSLVNVNLGKSNISKSKFISSKLKNINFSNSKVSDTLFNFATLENVNFSNCQDLLKVHFKDSELNLVNFNNSHIYGSTFIASILSEINFNGTEIISTSFTCSLLQKVDFITNKAMFDLDFRASNFNDTTFDCNIAKSLFYGCDSIKIDFRHLIEERLKSRLGKKSDFGSTYFSKKQVSKISVGVLSQNDIDEISSIYAKLQEESDK